MKDFFAFFYELFGLHSYDIAELYDYYATIGLVSVFVTLAAVILYYLVIDPVRRSTAGFWSLLMVVNGILLLIFNLIYLFRTFKYEGLDFSPINYLDFLLIGLLWNLIFFFLFSLLFKRFSTNCRRTPF